MRWLHVKIRGGLFALRCTANLYKQNSIAAVLRFHQCCLCTRLCPAKAPKTLLQKHRRAVVAMEGKGVVCVCRMWDFMEGGSLCLLASKTPFLGEGNSRFISMDALFLHVGSAVLLCQSPRYSRCESGRADDAGCDWLPYAGRALGEGRAAVLQQQSLGCVFASSSEGKIPR